MIRSAWHGAYRGIFTAAEIDAVFDGRSQMQGSWLERRRGYLGSLVAEAGGAIVGVAGVGTLAGGDGELGALYVLPEWQGRGVGTRLWEAVVAGLRERGFARLQVWTMERAAARRFYEARGCRLAERGVFQVGWHREPAVAYVLDL